MITIDDVNWLTRKEVIDTLGCSETYLTNLKKTNKLPFVRIQRRLRCKEEDFNNYLESVKNKGKESPFTNIMLDCDESCKFLYSYEPQTGASPYYVPSLKYLVTNKGRILNLDFTRELAQQKVDHGYLQIAIVGRNGQTIFLLVHRLVAGVWCPNYKMKPYVHHISGSRTDNNSLNLIWVTGDEHRELHDLLKNKRTEEYRSRISEIEKDNQYPQEWENGMTVLDPQCADDNWLTYLHLTKAGFEEYKETGVINPNEILREYAFDKKQEKGKRNCYEAF